MKALIWIVSLILAVPTFGVSLVIAFAITMHINKRERITAAQIMASAVSTLKNDVINKYYRLRVRERLSPTRKSDSDIFDSVMRCCTIIEGVLEKSGRFHEDKDDIIQLAARITSWSEDLESSTFANILTDELGYVASAGVAAALRRSYSLGLYDTEQKSSIDDDDIPF